MSTTNNILIFRIRDHKVALPLDHVQEVLMHNEPKPVPLAPDYVDGLFSLRGQIITSIDLITKIGHLYSGQKDQGADESTSDTDTDTHIIIKDGSELIGLRVDEVFEVVEIEEKDIEQSPSNLDKRWKSLSRGVYRIEEEVILILSVEELLTTGDITSTSEAATV